MKLEETGKKKKNRCGLVLTPRRHQTDDANRRLATLIVANDDINRRHATLIVVEILKLIVIFKVDTRALEEGDIALH